MNADYHEPAIQGMAAALTLGMATLLLLMPPPAPRIAMEAPKPTQVALSVVEEPPPPPPPPVPQLPLPEPPPPPVEAAPSPLPPPPPRPRHLQHPKRPPLPHAVMQPETPPSEMPRPVQDFARNAQQAPESHSAEAAYIGQLHRIVAHNTVLPVTAEYRLSHPSGETEIGFTLARSGALSGVHVIRSAGSATLDAQALAIVSEQRYPAMPPDVFPSQAAHAFSVPVNFTYTGNGDEL